MQGLGKTITGLALISKTRGALPESPMDPNGTPVKCTWVKDPTGRPAAFYTGVHFLQHRQPFLGQHQEFRNLLTLPSCFVNTVSNEAHRCLLGICIWLLCG